MRRFHQHEDRLGLIDVLPQRFDIRDHRHDALHVKRRGVAFVFVINDRLRSGDLRGLPQKILARAIAVHFRNDCQQREQVQQDGCARQYGKLPPALPLPPCLKQQRGASEQQRAEYRADGEILRQHDARGNRQPDAQNAQQTGKDDDRNFDPFPGPAPRRALPHRQVIIPVFRRQNGEKRVHREQIIFALAADGRKEQKRRQACRDDEQVRAGKRARFAAGEQRTNHAGQKQRPRRKRGERRDVKIERLFMRRFVRRGVAPQRFLKQNIEKIRDAPRHDDEPRKQNSKNHKQQPPRFHFPDQRGVARQQDERRDREQRHGHANRIFAQISQREAGGGQQEHRQPVFSPRRAVAANPQIARRNAKERGRRAARQHHVHFRAARHAVVQKARRKDDSGEQPGAAREDESRPEIGHDDAERSGDERRQPRAEFVEFPGQRECRRRRPVI